MKHLRNLAFAAGLALAAGAAQASVVKVTNNVTADTRWTANNVYVLDRVLTVEAPAILTIEPGTVIRGERATRTGDTANPADPGSVIVKRGAKIVANGTAESPIIWTSFDDTNVPGGATTNTVLSQENPGATNLTDKTYLFNAAGVLTNGRNYQVSQLNTSATNGFAYDSITGGLIVLGRARIAQGTTLGTEIPVDPTNGLLAANTGVGADHIEGFQNTGDGIYGGTNDDDDSGVVRFNSIRYGGFVLSPNNEINGLTMGGVGRGTVIEFVEVINNADDSFEFFGGTVDAKYLVSAFNGDDNFDYDEGYRGRGQFWFCVMDNHTITPPLTHTGRPVGNAGDNLMEMDGGEATGGGNPEGVTSRPNSIPRVYNLTLVGRGPNSIRTNAQEIEVRANAGGKLFNGIATDTRTTGMFNIAGTNGLGVDSAFQTIDRYYASRTTGGEFNIGTNAPGATEPDLIVRNWIFHRSTENTSSNSILTGMTVVGSSNIARTVVGAASNLNVFATSAQTPIRAIGRLSGLDPRASDFTKTNSALLAKDEGSYTNLYSFFTPTAFIGAMRDNNWADGWTLCSALGVFTNTATNINPVVTVGNNGSNPTVSFNALSGVWYSVEYTTDFKRYLPLQVVTNGSGTVTVTNTLVGLTNFSGYRVLAL